MNRKRLAARLEEAFEGTGSERRVVARQAGDLADSGRYAETHDGELTVEAVVDNLADAPEDYGLVERWNWWIGALDVAHGGYDQFRVNRWAVE